MFSADQLLNPIRADQPAGADLAFSPELDAIAQARKFDDPSLDQGEWVTDIKEADWEFVVKKCAALLETKSKDLRLAAWLTEAGAKKHQLRGMAEGFRLLAGLLEQFWDLGLYPESDGDDHDQRIGNLSFILGRTPALLREMRITEGTKGYSTVDFEVARKHANAVASGAPQGTGPKLADLENARKNSSAKFRAEFLADAQYCMEQLLALEKIADARFGKESPGFSAARDAVQNMVHLMPAPSATPAAPPPEPGTFYYAEPENDQGPPASSGPSQPSGPIRSRDQAITQLRNVAEFFRRTEPHSPVSYFADKAANAAEQDLHAWLRSVVKDPNSMAHIEELLGVKPPESN